MVVSRCSDQPQPQHLTTFVLQSSKMWPWMAIEPFLTQTTRKIENIKACKFKFKNTIFRTPDHINRVNSASKPDYSYRQQQPHVEHISRTEYEQSHHGGPGSSTFERSTAVLNNQNDSHRQAPLGSGRGAFTQHLDVEHLHEAQLQQMRNTHMNYLRAQYGVGHNRNSGYF